MIWLLALYAVAALALAALDLRRGEDFQAYALAGRRRSAPLVAASLLASMVGASATVGVAGLAAKVGAPAFWWLGSGALALVLGGVFLAPRLREREYWTLCDLLGREIGEAPRRLTAAVIVVGWTGIVASQFVAAAQVTAALSGWSFGASLLAAAALIVAYCALGGQAAVLRTDLLQLALLLGGIGVLLALLYRRTGLPAGGLDLALVNASFGPGRVGYFMIVVGSGFMIGPDVFSRLFTAASATAARRAAVAAGALLALVSAAVVGIGLWAHYFVVAGDVQPGRGVLVHLLDTVVGGWVGKVLSLGLLSAFLSSADTCMLSAATIFEHDLLGGRRVGRARLIIVGLGAAAAAVAAWRRDILDVMLLAYSLFNCGVVPVVLALLLGGRRRRMHPVWTSAAIACGGALGVAGKLAGQDALTLGGMGLSALLSLSALAAGGRIEAETPKE